MIDGTTYHLKVCRCPNHRVPVIKIFAQRLNMSLMEARAYVDELPKVLVFHTVESARSLAQELEAAGADVDLRRIDIQGERWAIIFEPVRT